MKNLFSAALLLLGLTFAATAQTPGGSLTLYTSQPEQDAAKTVAAYKSVYPGVTVQVFRSGTVEVMGKLSAEFAAGQPVADVLLIADAVSMESLKKDGRLLAYPGADVKGFPAGSFDADRTYFGSKLITSGIAFNTASTVKPASWQDLLRTELKGQISMPSPLYSGAAAIQLSTLAARSDLGWKFFETLKANGATPVQGNGAVLKAVSSGEKTVGILVDYMAFNAKAKGSPIDFVFPKEGVTAVTEPVAVLKTTKNPAAARAFVDFILSDAGQKLALDMGYIPAKSGAGTPAWLPAGTKINLMPIDTAAVLKTGDADKQKFSDLFSN